MSGRRTFEEPNNVEAVDAASISTSIAFSLVDPLFRELGTQGHFYAHHCRFATYIPEHDNVPS